MLADIAKAKIVITNYHAFQKRETLEVSKVGRALLQGRGEPPITIETEGQMLRARLRRAAGAQERRRHQRRGAPLLSREARHARAKTTLRRRREGRGEEEQRGRAALDHRHRGA